MVSGARTRRATGRVLALSTLAFLAAGPASAGAGTTIVVASTTSTESSGLFRHILPLFEKASGIAVKVVAVGTGQAIRLAQRGDADVLLVHHRPSEERFVAEGFGVRRHEVMYNDFLLVGPKSDPAGIAGGRDVLRALQAIAGRGTLFLSRGDESGTHRLERELWQAVGSDPAREPWYRETGSGMGATLNTAAGMGAYTLADRGSWASFANKTELAVLVEGDERLFNPYGVILVDPQRHPHVKAEAGQVFIDWLVGPEGQRAIASFTVAGQPLFFPSARPGGA